MFSVDKHRKIRIIYDGECPVCKTYVAHMRLKKNYGVVELVNARDDELIARHFRDKGMSLDEGMVVKLDDSEFYGADAVNVLAMLSSDSGVFNRFNALVFSNATVCKLLYPLMRTGRNILLRLLRKSKID